MSDKVKISQKEINDIYEITKEDPFPKVVETVIKNENTLSEILAETKAQEESILTEEEQVTQDLFDEINQIPQEDKGETN